MDGAVLFLFETQPQLLFYINCVPCCRMSPLPLFPRNCVESLHHFFVRFVFAIFFHFHRIFRFGSNRHHSPRHVALRSRLLPPLVVDIFAESARFLDRTSSAVQGDYMARYNYAPVMPNHVLVWEVFLSPYECQSPPHLNPVCLFCGVCLVELWLKFDRASHCQLFEKLGGLCLAYN